MLPEKVSRILFFFFLLLAGIYVFSLWNRYPDIDDAWIGEHAYWQAKEGHVRSELMRGIVNQEERVLVHHKLFTLQGAVFIRVLGFTPDSLRVITLLHFLVFLVIFYLYTVRWKKIFTNKTFLLALIILISFPSVFKYSYVFRPEITVMMLAFVSYIFLEKVIGNKKAGTVFSLLAGLLAGLSVSYHLNGVVVAGAGFLLLAWNRRWSHAGWYSLATLSATALYFYDFSSEYGLSYWFYQLTNTPAVNNPFRSSLVGYLIINFSKEHMRFFHNETITFFSICSITILALGFKQLRQSYRTMMRYTFLLILLMGIFAIHKTIYYILVYFPFVVILITRSIYIIIHGDPFGWEKRIKRKYAVYFIYLFIFLQCFNGIYYGIRLSARKFSTEKYREVTQKYVSEDPSTVKIIAPMIFIFNEIKYYQRIQGELCFTEMLKKDTSIYKDGFLRKAGEFDADYIFLSTGYKKNLGLRQMNIGDTLAGYRMIDMTPEMSILKRESVH